MTHGAGACMQCMFGARCSCQSVGSFRTGCNVCLGQQNRLSYVHPSSSCGSSAAYACVHQGFTTSAHRSIATEGERISRPRVGPPTVEQ